MLRGNTGHTANVRWFLYVAGGSAALLDDAYLGHHSDPTHPPSVVAWSVKATPSGSVLICSTFFVHDKPRSKDVLHGVCGTNLRKQRW
ncbi:hypothetical protein N7468_004873 [Penicillium chermesinum]|uniref:Uncharacterized protein n=1 Tax=Penicillium chermesinum TaxID=63820 RepID=A0A9W9P9D5_9EURO|nr:uncharacterized protein N7468_004873 [Penicillium chermesinum]KAJ5240254.1 hypothetical protein N7468_004873 [Penicillium chermesinum]